MLELLRARGYGLAHHPPELAICRLPARDPNESLLERLTLANLLSQRSGSEEAAALGIRGGASVEALREQLDALAALPEPRSPYVLRTFDRKLARKRLDALA